MGVKYTNNAYSTLASGITNVATSISVQAGHGARFPSIADANEYFYCTLADSSNNLEIVKVTARSTDTLTVTRGAEGTTNRAYTSGDRIELRVTAAGLSEFASPHIKGAAIASAGTITIPDGASFFHVTGTTTITDIDFTTASNGRWAWFIFDGALTLTHNATTLVLPGGANITTAANDRALFVQDATDNVYCLVYERANGVPVTQPVSTTDNTLPRFDGTAGKLQTSGITVDDSGNVSGVGTLNAAGVVTVGFAAAGGAASGLFTSGNLLFRDTTIQLQDAVPTFTTTFSQSSTQTLIANNAGATTRLLVGSNANSLGLTLNNVGLLTLDAGQIAMPATQNASAGANTWDDYEEGTGTPNVGGTATYTAQSLGYTKIGDAYSFRGRIIINAIGTGSTSQMSGMPFTSSGSLNAVSIGYYASIVSTADWIGAYCANGVSTMTMTGTTAAAASATDAFATFGAGAYVLFSGVIGVSA